MFHEITTNKAIETIIEDFQELASEYGFSILHQYDFFNILEGKGFPIERKVLVFEICRASMASSMLTHFPIFSVMMPCRISVYEDDGKTHIATMDMLPMLEKITDQNELINEAKELFLQLLALMSQLAC